MNNLMTNTVLGHFTMTFIISSTWAQQRSGKGMSQVYSRNYDMNTVKTINGKVVEFSYRSSRNNGVKMGVHITVKTEMETIPVHLGPLWYISEQDSLYKGDIVEITGSRIAFNGDKVIVAVTVKRDEMTLRLRYQNGFPIWRGEKEE